MEGGQGWRDGSGGKVFAMQAWEPELGSPDPKKVGMAACLCDPNPGEQRQTDRHTLGAYWPANTAKMKNPRSKRDLAHVMFK